MGSAAASRRRRPWPPLAAQAAKLEKEFTLYERAMESCDELARENDDLRARLKDATDFFEEEGPFVGGETGANTSNILGQSRLLSEYKRKIAKIQKIESLRRLKLEEEIVDAEYTQTCDRIVSLKDKIKSLDLVIASQSNHETKRRSRTKKLSVPGDGESQATCNI